MKPRYNLRIQSIQQSFAAANRKARSILSSRVNKKSKFRPSKSVNNQQTHRRHSLRLKPITKPQNTRSIVNETIPKWHHIENDHQNEGNSVDSDDNYDDLLARHHRHMLEEQKDRKLYERYVRGQRSLRSLQCRRTHTAHLSEATRNRLLRELERERRYDIQDKICAYLANHTIIFQHGCNIESKQPITWSTLEEEIPNNRNVGTIHQLDIMIANLKRVIQNSKSSTSKPRLSVRERQNQRLATAVTPSITTKLDVSQTKELNTSLDTSNSTLNLPSQAPLMSYFPRVPVVRFIDSQTNRLQINNSQHLTCIQNVLLHDNNEQTNNNHHHRNLTNEVSTSNASRKSVLRSQSILPYSSPTKKRPLEKENYSITSNSSIALRTTPPYVTANDHIPNRSSLFSIEWYRSNIPHLLRRLVPTRIRENIR